MSPRVPTPMPPLIVCPLQFEAMHLRRALPAWADRIVTCGPGGLAVERTLARHEASAVVLAGLAGGLDRDHRAGSAHVVTEVRDGHGRTHSAAVAQDVPVCRITSVAIAVKTSEERRMLAERTGAHLVDMESEAFAAFAVARGLHWTIVRGVSDDPDQDLPAWVTSLTNENGRVLLGRCLTAVMTNPARIVELRRLRRDSVLALGGVGDLLRVILEP